MLITLNLWSTKEGEIKNFLEKYYQEEVEMKKDTGMWLKSFSKPLETVDVISSVIDNNDKFDIAVYIQMKSCDLFKVTENNYNDVIRDMFILFHEDGVAV